MLLSLCRSSNAVATSLKIAFTEVTTVICDEKLMEAMNMIFRPISVFPPVFSLAVASNSKKRKGQ
jgi:hypothetical protein